MPRIGDTFLFAVDTNVYAPKSLVGGVYDFSNLKKVDTSVNYYIANDNFTQYASANLKLTIDSNTQGSTYFKTTSNDMFLLGLSDITSQIPFPISNGLTGSLKYLTFPMTSTTNVTSYDSLKFSIPAALIPSQINIDSLVKALIPGIPSGAVITVDSISVAIQLKLNLYVDGFGKIKTPIDSNIDVLKLVRKISVTPKVMIHGKATYIINIPINYDITNLISGQLPLNLGNIVFHSYISSNFKQEIVNASVDSSGNYQNVNYRYKTKVAAGNASVSSPPRENIDIYLQGDILKLENLKSSEIYEVFIYDLSGRVVLHTNVTFQNPAVLWRYNSGNYIVRVVNEDSILTKKISIE